jgi:hypothetical protein
MRIDEAEGFTDSVINWAKSHYDEHGWDILIECHTKEEIVAFLVRTKVRTFNGAMNAVWAEFVKYPAMQRTEIHSTAF